MDKQAIFRKTVKGTEAINERLHGLVGKLRPVLILVDGKRSDAELAQLASCFGAPALLLSQLESEGFIERLPAANVSSAALTPRDSTPEQADLGRPSLPLPLLKVDSLSEGLPAAKALPANSALRTPIAEKADPGAPSLPLLTTKVESLGKKLSAAKASPAESVLRTHIAEKVAPIEPAPARPPLKSESRVMCQPVVRPPVAAPCAQVPRTPAKSAPRSGSVPPRAESRLLSPLEKTALASLLTGTQAAAAAAIALAKKAVTPKPADSWHESR